MLPVLVPVVTHLTEISFVANGPTVITDVSIKIILKKVTSDKNNIKNATLAI